MNKLPFGQKPDLNINKFVNQFIVYLFFCGRLQLIWIYILCLWICRIAHLIQLKTHDKFFDTMMNASRSLLSFTWNRFAEWNKYKWLILVAGNRHKLSYYRVDFNLNWAIFYFLYFDKKELFLFKLLFIKRERAVLLSNGI